MAVSAFHLALLLLLCSSAQARKFITHSPGGAPSSNWFAMKLVEVSYEPHEVSKLKSRLVDHFSHLGLFNFPERIISTEDERLVSPMDGVPQNFICETCLNVSMKLQEALSDPETLDFVIHYVNHSFCDGIMPGLEKECAGLVAKYMPEVINDLQQYVTPNRLCLDTHICSGPETLLLNDDRTCALCQDFATEALQYIGENKTQTEVLSALHASCSKLKGFQSKCYMLVDLYAPIIFSEAASCTPQELCQKIKFCTPFLLKSNSRCDTCEQMISQLKVKLRDPITQLKLIESLMNECKTLTDHVDQCKALVFHYGPLILANMDKLLDADMLCSKIHACDRQQIASAMKEDDKTTLGPSIYLPSVAADGHQLL